MEEIIVPSTSALTQPEDFAREVSQMVFLDFANSSNSFWEFHNPHTNMIYNTRVPIFNQPGPVIGDAAGCGALETSGQFITNTEVVWTPTEVGMKLAQCYQVLLNTVLAPLVKRKFRPAELIGSPQFMAFLGQIFTKNFWDHEHWRFYWLSDPALVAANFTGSAAALVPLYTKITGFWKQLTTIGYDCSAAAPLLTASNATGSVAANLAFLNANPTTGKEACDAVINGCTIDLRNHPDARICLTDALWNNLKQYLGTLYNEAGWYWIQEKGQVDYLSYGGYKVYNLREVSKALDRDFRIASVPPLPYNAKNPATYRIANMNRACMFVPTNLNVGLDGDAMMSAIEPHYDSHTREVQLLGSYQTDAKIYTDMFAAFAV